MIHRKNTTWVYINFILIGVYIIYSSKSRFLCSKSDIIKRLQEKKWTSKECIQREGRKIAILLWNKRIGIWKGVKIIDSGDASFRHLEAKPAYTSSDLISYFC